MEHQLLDRKSYQRFCLLEDAITISDRNTIWRFPSASVWRAQRHCSRAWMPSCSAMAALPGAGQAIDATLVPAYRQGRQGTSGPRQGA